MPMIAEFANFIRLIRDRRGVSAVEFALIAPLMIALYLGCVEISDGVAVDRKVSLTAAAVANLTAQSTSSNISATEMSNILDAAAAIVAPYSASNLKITVSCVNIDANKNVTVKWSATRNGGVGTPVSIPSALQVPGQLIVSQASYAYTPIVGHTITGTLTLSDRMFMTPRTQAPSYPTTSTPCKT